MSGGKNAIACVWGTTWICMGLQNGVECISVCVCIALQSAVVCLCVHV